jgi:hypothetical protein
MPIKKPQPVKKDNKGFRHHIAALKLKLISATELSDILTYFFDHLGENEAFFDLGFWQNLPFLEQVLRISAHKVITEGEIQITNLQMIRLPEYKFIHGSGLFNQYLTTYIYFEDIDVGLLALALFPPNDFTHLIRFSCQKLGQPLKLPVN